MTDLAILGVLVLQFLAFVAQAYFMRRTVGEMRETTAATRDLVTAVQGTANAATQLAAASERQIHELMNINWEINVGSRIRRE
jgi:hypothetical protein